MFYNVIGLAFVSCFICAVVNAIDDFNSMNEAVKWAARSLTHRSRTASKASSFHAELQQCDRIKTKLEHKGQQIDQSFFGGLSTIDPRATNNETRWHENNGLSNEDWKITSHNDQQLNGQSYLIADEYHLHLWEKWELFLEIIMCGGAKHAIEDVN